MLKGFTALVLLQLLGSIVNWAFLPLLPGPIIGMLLLLGWLMLQGGVSDAISARQVGCCSICRCCWWSRRWAS